MELNKIYNESCLDTMARMQDGAIDLTVTSPPYDNLRTYKGYRFDLEPIARELFRVTKDGGIVVWVVNDATINGSETGTSFKQALYFKECGFRLHDTMIFAKTNPMPTETSKRYRQTFEYMFIFSKGKPYVFNAIKEPSVSKRKYKSNWGRKNDYMLSSTGSERITSKKKVMGNIFYYSISVGGATKDKLAFKHPAIFPEQLANDHIISWSNEGDIVYDPFIGSGTTAKMALANKRQYIGSEVSAEYIEIAKERLKQTKLF